MPDFPLLKLDSLSSGDQADLADAVFDQLRPVQVVMGQDWNRPQVTGLNLTLSMTEVQHVWNIERIAIPQTRVEVGSTLRVTVDLREHYGELKQEDVSVVLPEGIKSGTVEVRVAGAQALDQHQLGEELDAIKDTTQLIDQLNRRRSRDRIYLQLVVHEPGQVIAQYELPSLPASVRTVMEDHQQSDPVVPLNERIWLETSLPIAGVVDGVGQVTLEIK